MTLYGAISNLVMMREHPMMPSMFYSSLDKIIETVSECEEPETNYSEIPNSWIPCSERLPEKEVDVLCCRNNKTVAIMHFNPVLTTRYPKGFSVIKNDFSWRQDNVVAWMPLPEPYQPDGFTKWAKSVADSYRNDKEKSE